MEGYRLPSVLCKKNPDLPKRVKPVFLDQTDIQPRQLHDELRIKLEQSRFLIVICSPRSAKSQWVGEEIDYFIQLGRKDNVIAYIIDGEPYSRNSETECYHEVIRRNFPAADNPKEDRQLLGVNLNEAGSGSRRMKRQRAFIKVLSRLLDLSFDELWKRQRRRTVRNILIYIVLIMIFLVTVGFVWQSNQPFDVKVSLKEVTEHNEKLPFENGKIALVYDRDTLYSTAINKDDYIADFLNVPGKYRNKKARLWFEMYGYEQNDTLSFLTEKMELAIKRDSAWAIFKGVVCDEQNQPVEKADVIVANYQVVTDDMGRFCIHIPVLEQTVEKQLHIQKKDYAVWEYTISPSLHEQKIILEKN